MSEVFDELGRPARAGELRTKAAALFKRFNEAFWDEELGFYAFALDGEKKKVLTVASNAGHCLWSGIVPPERAGKVVKRLMAPDMWSGWGIRTLSALHPAFNPYNYKTGSVWPHDNAIIALGFKRYDSTQRSQGSRAISAMQEATSRPISRLSSIRSSVIEGAFRSISWRQHPTGLGSGWSSFRRRYLGCAGRPRGKLYVDPSLPQWLPDLTVLDLRLGTGLFDIRFWRDGGETRFDVLRGAPELSRVGPSVTAEFPVQCRTLCDAHRITARQVAVESLHALDWQNFPCAALLTTAHSLRLLASPGWGLPIFVSC
jgi:hypothetical protein